MPPDIFANDNDIVLRSQRQTNWNIAGIYHGIGNYGGKQFTDDCENVASLVYHDEDGECAPDLEDFIAYCFVRHICERVENGESGFSVPEGFNSQDLTKSNVYLRLLFEKNSNIEDGAFVFEVGFYKYRTDYMDQAQLVW